MKDERQAMIFWFAAAALAAAVTYAVTRPLAAGSADNAADDAAAADLAVYKDQLREIEADASRGALAPGDADAARAEVARRMIRRAEDGAKSPASERMASARTARIAYLAATLALPLASAALYLSFGAPGLPGQPLSARLQTPNDAAHADDLVAKVEAALRKNPDDGKGWDVIAPVYAAQARFADAAQAYQNATRLLGESAGRLQGFAVARIGAENGLVTDDARAALERTRTLDPQRVEPRIWLAVAKEQDGDLAGAATEYRAILSKSAADAPWLSMLTQRLAAIDGAGAAPPSVATRDPTAAEVAAFEAMTPDQRAAKINDMVEGLAARLKAQPNDLNGWQKLIRAYTALGRRDDALKAAADARAGLASDANQVQKLDAWMKELGLAG
ncbi:MAG: c-type cytochrome biogenesis protein CcmI [Hyphomicrobium sp.]